MPALFYRLLKNDTHSRVLANPQLRTSEGLTAQARFGERVPVPSVTFAPIATGGVNQQPITSFTYEPIGVNIDLTPRLHHNDEVSLTVKIEVSNVSGTGFNDLPTFGNRSISTTIRLKDGETNMLAGLIRDDERRSLSGLAGLGGRAGHRPAVRAQLERDAADRHHPDADPAHHPGAGAHRSRPPPLPRRPRRQRHGDRSPAAPAADRSLAVRRAIRRPASSQASARQSKLGPPGLPAPRTRPSPTTPGTRNSGGADTAAGDDSADYHTADDSAAGPSA